MEKFAINLLPQEVSAAQEKQDKFSRVQYICIGVILVLILISSISVALRIIQTQNINKLESQVAGLEEQVGQLKDKESLLVVLKNRLGAITQLLARPTRQTEIYNLISSQIPADASITTISVDRTGNSLVALLLPNSNSLEQLLSGLTSDESFKKIAKIEVESLASGRDGIYRVNLKILQK